MSKRGMFHTMAASMLIAALLAPPLDAQLRTTGKQRQTTVSAAATTAIAPELVALKTHADLVIRDLGFTGSGEVTFELRNRGDVPINPAPARTMTPTAVGGRPPAVPESQQIKVNVYLGGAILASVYQPRLAGREGRVFKVVVPVQKRPACAAARSLRTVIDPSLVITELTDTNNTDTVTAARPCPDLAIQSIERNWNELKTEYVARVTLVNKGNADAPSFEMLAMAGSSSIFNALPDFDEHVEGLAPGQTKKFNIGSAFATNRLWVRVWLDRRGLVEELDESNNLKDKEFD